MSQIDMDGVSSANHKALMSFRAPVTGHRIQNFEKFKLPIWPLWQVPKSSEEDGARATQREQPKKPEKDRDPWNHRVVPSHIKSIPFKTMTQRTAPEMRKIDRIYLQV